jgi:D-cysteine desulfhydrase
LIVGTRLFGSKAKIRAFNVCDSASYFGKKIREDVSLWKQRYEIDIDEDDLEISTLEGYMGPGYGEADDIVFETIAKLARTEGLFLDPVYTGKAFHGMINELQLGDEGQLPGARNVVFVHTGGLFGIFPQQKYFKFN